MSIPRMGRTACTEPQCLYSRTIPLLPLLAYGLYRASVPVQGRTLPYRLRKQKTKLSFFFYSRFRKIANVCPSAWNNSAPNGRIFMTFDI